MTIAELQKALPRPSEEARKYVGQQEIRGNKGFLSPAFEAEMKEEGWVSGYAWCVIFSRVVYLNCYPEKVELKKLFVPGVLKTYMNFKDAGYLIANFPQVDSLVCWAQMKDGVKTGFGHAGIVTEVLADGFKSIEGNTSSPGVREGYIVRENAHKMPVSVANGLKLLGFVQISPPITIA